MRIDRVCVICKHAIGDNHAGFGVEEETPVKVLPDCEVRNLRTTWYTLFVQYRDSLQGTMDCVSTPSGGRV